VAEFLLDMIQFIVVGCARRSHYFQQLTLELFVDVTVPTSILHMLSCNLLRHFFDSIDNYL